MEEDETPSDDSPYYYGGIGKISAIGLAVVNGICPCNIIREKIQYEQHR